MVFLESVIRSCLAQAVVGLASQQFCVLRSGMAPARKRKAAAEAATPSPKVPKGQSAESRAAQKVRETFAHLTAEETDILVSPLSGKTLRKTLIDDCQAEASGSYIRWGKGYTEERTNEFRSPASTHEKLRVGPDDTSIPTPCVRGDSETCNSPCRQ